MVSTTHDKVLSLRDIVLFTVSGMLLVDFIAITTAVGSNSLFWWPVFMVTFFIPIGLITAELGSRFPEQGGIYSWVRRAFGYRSGSRITWYYWVNVALWMPSVYLMFSGTLSSLFFPDMGLWTQIAVGIALAIFTYAINVMALDLGKWIPNVGAVLKAIVSLSLGVGGLLYGWKNGFANDISFSHFFNNLDEIWVYIPVIVYGLLGFELVCASSDEMKNPSKDIPKAIFISAPIIAGSYLLGAWGIIAAVPVENIDAVDVIAVTLFNLFGDSGIGGFFAYTIGTAALLSFLANIATWTMGANRAAAEASEEGELPAVFGKLHPVNKTPMGAAALTALISIVVQVVYGFMADNAEDLFWSIFSFSAIIFLIPYIFMCLAFIRLRKEYPHRQGSFKIPGGAWLAYSLAGICSLILMAAIVLFIYQPDTGIDWVYATPILIGVSLCLLMGEALVRFGESRNPVTHHESEELAPGVK